jgi:hypothetical protein
VIAGDAGDAAGDPKVDHPQRKSFKIRALTTFAGDAGDTFLISD